MSFKFKAEPIATVAGTYLDYNGKEFQTTPTTVIIVRKVKDWNSHPDFEVCHTSAWRSWECRVDGLY